MNLSPITTLSESSFYHQSHGSLGLKRSKSNLSFILKEIENDEEDMSSFTDLRRKTKNMSLSTQSISIKILEHKNLKREDDISSKQDISRDTSVESFTDLSSESSENNIEKDYSITDGSSTFIKDDEADDSSEWGFFTL